MARVPDLRGLRQLDALLLEVQGSEDWHLPSPVSRGSVTLSTTSSLNFLPTKALHDLTRASWEHNLSHRGPAPTVIRRIPLMVSLMCFKVSPAGGWGDIPTQGCCPYSVSLVLE